MKNNVWVVVPNVNGADDLPTAIDAVLGQSHKNLTLVIVDNGSTDTSRQVIESYRRKDPRVTSIYLDKNYGFTGGMNPGMELALKQKANYIAGCNNDAKPHKDWLKHLVAFLDSHPTHGMAACKLLRADGKTLDSTGEQYSVWGLPFPRGRDEPTGNQYDQQTTIFGASGGASLYRASMLRQIGLFDQDFFAYNEDVDLSFRAQLRGWKVGFVPGSIVYHAQGNTTNKMGNGFTAYQTMKNLPLVLWKNVPGIYFWRVLPRLAFAQCLFLASAMRRGQGRKALQGLLKAFLLLPKKLWQRRAIQHGRTVTPGYIWGIMRHDLPPDAVKLHTLRARWRRIIGRRPA